LALITKTKRTLKPGDIPPINPLIPNYFPWQELLPSTTIFSAQLDFTKTKIPFKTMYTNIVSRYLALSDAQLHRQHLFMPNRKHKSKQKHIFNTSKLIEQSSKLLLGPAIKQFAYLWLHDSLPYNTRSTCPFCTEPLNHNHLFLPKHCSKTNKFLAKYSNPLIFTDFFIARFVIWKLFNALIRNPNTKITPLSVILHKMHTVT